MRKRKIQSYGIILLRRNLGGYDGFIRPNTPKECKDCVISPVISELKPPTANYSVLVMQKRNSHAYYDIVTGRILSGTNVQKLVDELTCGEKRRIYSWSFDRLWMSLWTHSSFRKYNSHSERTFSEDLFRRNRATLMSAIEASSTHYPLSEFGFPKGRKNNKESNLKCALREFCEETGYDHNKILIPDHNIKIIEDFEGSDGVSYMHCYYVGEIMIPDATPFISRDNCEVRNIGWLSVDNLKEVFRSYEVSKYKVVDDLIDHLNSKNSFVCA